MQNTRQVVLPATKLQLSCLRAGVRGTTGIGYQGSQTRLQSKKLWESDILSCLVHPSPYRIRTCSGQGNPLMGTERRDKSQHPQLFVIRSQAIATAHLPLASFTVLVSLLSAISCCKLTLAHTCLAKAVFNCWVIFVKKKSQFV